MRAAGPTPCCTSPAEAMSAVRIRMTSACFALAGLLFVLYPRDPAVFGGVFIPGRGCFRLRCVDRVALAGDQCLRPPRAWPARPVLPLSANRSPGACVD